jgi:hypothetical protein
MLMATPISSTPIAPKGMGPGSVLLLIVLLLGFGAFYWLSHDPNALDAFSDLKRTFDAPAAAPPPAAPPPAAQPAVPEARAADSGIRPEEEQIRKKIDEEIARLDKEMRAKLDREFAEANGDPAADAAGGSLIVFIADPDCAPIGRQWLVSGKVFNPGAKAVRSRRATITLLIDGEPAEKQTVVVGPFEPQEIQSYQVLFRPSRNTRNHTVTARAGWR